MTTPHTAAEILRLARAKIDTPEKWTQGFLARDEHGLGLTSMEYEHAACFCIIGALQASGDSDSYAEILLERAIHGNDGYSVANWNDDPGRTHTEILAAFDRAIQLADQGRQGE